MARWADSVGMISCTSCIGSDRNRSIVGQPSPSLIFSHYVLIAEMQNHGIYMNVLDRTEADSTWKPKLSLSETLQNFLGRFFYRQFILFPYRGLHAHVMQYNLGEASSNLLQDFSSFRTMTTMCVFLSLFLFSWLRLPCAFCYH